MEVAKTTEHEWFVTESTPPKSTEIIKEKQSTETPEGEVHDKVDEEEEEDVDEVVETIIPEDVVQVFEKLKADKTKNFAWYEDTPIDSYEKAIDFIEFNVNDRFSKEVEKVDQVWYQSKTEAFQRVAQLAEMAGDDFDKVAAYIEREKFVQDIEKLDPSDVENAETIVSEHMKLRGEAPEVILEEIKDLKERDKLVERAKKYQPVLVDNQKKANEAVLETERKNLESFYGAIEQNNKEVIKFLSEPKIAGMDLKNEDKGLVYQALVYNPDIKGFGINKLVEDKHREKKFDLLAKVALLLEDEEKFEQMYTTRIKGKVAKDYQKKIRYAADQVEGQDDTKPATIKTTKPKTTPEQEYNPWKAHD